MAVGLLRSNGTERHAPLELREYGWNFLPAGVPDRDRAVTRPLQRARKIAGVLPPTMRGLTELLTILAPNQLVGFCQRVEIAGSRPLLDEVRVERVKGAIERRLTVTALESDRKVIQRALAHINPATCRPPIDALTPSCTGQGDVAFSATAAEMHGRLLAGPSTAGWPVLARMVGNGVEFFPPPPAERFVLAVDPRDP